MNQVARDDELLATARDCFYFITNFFEPISVSATHIYHSALELSPLSSIVRKLYYHQQHTPFPKIVAGIPKAWNGSIYIPVTQPGAPCTWSPCGQFVATGTEKTVKIWDALSSELLSTLIKPDVCPTGKLVYSPDGHSLTTLSNASLTIWDIQTGGVVKEIEHSNTNNVSLVWSLDGGIICAIFQDKDTTTSYAVYVYDITSGITSSPGTLESRGEPHLWAHNTSFWVMTRELDGEACTINISEVGSVLTKTESFCVPSQINDCVIRSFSPTTYRACIFFHVTGQTQILDIQSLGVLFDQRGDICSSCFSSEGSLFAAFFFTGLHIWKHTSSCYVLWKKFPPQDPTHFFDYPPQFSPTLSSISGYPNGALQVWHLDDPNDALQTWHSGGSPNHYNNRSHMLRAVISWCGTYIVDNYVGNGTGTVTITNLHSQTPPHFISTGMEVANFALTGNILLAWDWGELVAWRLTGDGAVDGVSSNRWAGHGDSIWAVSLSKPTFSVEGQTVIIKEEGNAICHIYHTGTGEVLEPAQESPNPCHHQYSFGDIRYGKHYPHYHRLRGQGILPEGNWQISEATLQEGWVKDPEGRYRLWIPIEWRIGLSNSSWLSNITTLWLKHRVGVTIVMF